jgi:hypothetical protein
VTGRASFLAIAICLVSRRVDGAPSTELWGGRLEIGAAVPTDHLQPMGGGGRLPPGYLSLTLERRIAPRVVLAVTGGVSLSVGWVAAGLVRYALVDTPNARVSLGGGPILLDDVDVGLGLLVSGDVLAEACPDGRVCLSLGVNEGIILNRAGTPGCGTDTCNAYFVPGDQVFTLRFGIGYRF